MNIIFKYFDILYKYLIRLKIIFFKCVKKTAVLGESLVSLHVLLEWMTLLLLENRVFLLFLI